MDRCQHPTNNGVLNAPPGMSIEECHALPITNVRFAEGGKGIVSFWTPTAEELARMAAGKPVRLTVLGTMHPPVAIGVDGDGWL